MKNKIFKYKLAVVLAMLFLLSIPKTGYSNVGKLASGTVKTVSSVFYIPTEILRDSQQVMFPFGIVTGTVKGAFKTVGGLLSGALDLACGAAPYAKYLVFL